VLLLQSDELLIFWGNMGLLQECSKVLADSTASEEDVLSALEELRGLMEPIDHANGARVLPSAHSSRCSWVPVLMIMCSHAP